MLEKDERLITLKKVESEIDAISLRDYLKIDGIEAAILTYHDTMFDGISQDWMEGLWGEVQVLEHELEHAEGVLKTFEEQRKEAEKELES